MAPHRLEDPRGIGVAGEERLDLAGSRWPVAGSGVSASVAARNSSGVRAKKAGRPVMAIKSVTVPFGR